VGRSESKGPVGKEGHEGEEKAPCKGIAKPKDDEPLGCRTSHDIGIRARLLEFPVEMEFRKEDEHQEEGKETEGAHGVEVGIKAEVVLNEASQHGTQTEPRKEGYGKNPHVAPSLSVGEISPT